MYDNGTCLHALAPKPWFGKPTCILAHPPKNDIRTVYGCKLQYPFKRPDAPPSPSPARIVKSNGQFVGLQPIHEYTVDAPPPSEP